VIKNGVIRRDGSCGRELFAIGTDIAVTFLVPDKIGTRIQTLLTSRLVPHWNVRLDGLVIHELCQGWC
jgi:hypothetical protein